jgi:hypothetical protein
MGLTGLKDGAWDDVADCAQKIGFNRAATTYQWNDLRFTFDLDRYEYVDFHCHGKEFDMKGRTHAPQPPLPGCCASTDKCLGLIGTGFGIEAANHKRCFLYIDSILVSAREA